MCTFASVHVYIDENGRKHFPHIVWKHFNTDRESETKNYFDNSEIHLLLLKHFEQY